MLKKLLSVLLSVCIIFLLCGCTAKKSAGAEKYGYDNNDTESMIGLISEQTENYIADINERKTALFENSEKNISVYKSKKTDISAFYADTLSHSGEFYEFLKVITADYYRCVREHHFADYTTWNNAMKDLYRVWTDAMEDYADAWSDSYEEVYKTCDDMVESGYDDLPYKEYYKLYNEMYKEYSRAYSDIYGLHSDSYGELYNTYSDIWSAFYSGEGDIEDILKIEISEPQNNSSDDLTEEPQNGTFDDSTEKLNTDDTSAVTKDGEISIDDDELIEDPETYINAQIEKLTDEYENLAEKIDSYDAYVDNAKTVRAFYEKVTDISYDLSVDLYRSALLKAQKALNSDMDNDELYDSVDDIYDYVYEYAGDALYDGIYDGILTDMLDDFYDGVIYDAVDTVEYTEWSKIRSDEYKMWSSARSDCYKHVSEMRSDVYKFISDLRSEIYGNDIERAKKITADFEKDVEKLSK